MNRRTFVLGSLGFLLGGDAVAAARLRAGDPRLRELAGLVRGPVIGRSSSMYGNARLLFNERFDAIRPLAVLRALGADDVRRAILWARKHDIRIAVRSGGHSYGGYSLTSGLVIDVRKLSGIAVNRSQGRATIGAGSQLIDVYTRLAKDGLTLPAGSCPTVGIAGLALGGGIGFASRKLGTTADNIASVRIVAADGRLLTCNPRKHADLYWACRGGGGGNFGVVTSFVFRVHPVSTASRFVITWPWTSMEQVLTAWQAFAPFAPDELFSICRLATGATQPSVQAFGQFFGSEAALTTILAPLLQVPGASLTSGTSTYLELVKRWAQCKDLTVPECHVSPSGKLARGRFAAKSDYVRQQLPPDGIRTMRDRLEARQGKGSGALLLDSYGGAINRVAPAATAFVHRRELFSIQYFAPSTDAATLAWLRHSHAAMRPYVSGFSYQNYVDPDLAGWEKAYYGSNYARLRAVKKKYDPDNVFRFRQSVRPRK